MEQPKQKKRKIAREEFPYGRKPMVYDLSFEAW